MFVIVGISWWRLIRPFSTIFAPNPTSADGLSVVWGAILQTAALAMGLIFSSQAYRHYQVGLTEKDPLAFAEAPANPDLLVSTIDNEALLLRPPHAYRYVDNSTYLIGLFAGLAISLLACMFGSEYVFQTFQ
jgi:hypothetical protein